MMGTRPAMALPTWRHDALGGASAAASGFPLELIYGPIAFAALGTAEVIGMQAALWSCVLSGILACLFRSTPGIIYGTRPSIVFVLAALVATLGNDARVMASSHVPGLLVALVFLCVSLAGCLQLLFSMLRLGRALKFTPYPVLSGLMVGVALLTAAAAMKQVLGLPDGSQWANLPGQWHPLSALVAATTFLFCVVRPRWLQPVPFIIVGLCAGTAMHYLLALLFGIAKMGGVSVGSAVFIPALPIWQYARVADMALLFELAPLLLPYALAIATIGALDSLMCLQCIESTTQASADSDRELRAQGLINACLGVAGGLPASGVVPRVMANLHSGGRRRSSALFYSASMVMLVLCSGWWMALLPRAAIAGGALYFAWAIVDTSTRRLFASMFVARKQTGPAQYRLLLANVCVVVLVAAVAVIGDIVKAAGVGVVAAMFLFAGSNAKSLIRTIGTAERLRSLKVRPPQANTMLDRQGMRIVVLELEGILFFGTADQLVQQARRLAPDTVALVLEMSRLRDIDSTGANAFRQVAQMVQANGAAVLIAGASQTVRSALNTFGSASVVPHERWHYDVDQALEEAEDLLLEIQNEVRSGVTLELGQSMLAQNLTPAEVAILSRHLLAHAVSGEMRVFGAGDQGDSLYVAANGVVNITVPMENGQSKRVASFAPGVIFGEMSFIERCPRSADARATDCSLIWEFSRQQLHNMERDYPELARKLMLNLTRSLSDRLRTTTRALCAVAEENA